MSQKIIAAISGGVDSAVATTELQKMGYDILGVTLRLLPRFPGEDEAFERSSTAVRTLTEKLGIEHRFLDVRQNFMEEVLIPSWTELCNGKTPNPCALCNAALKFGKLLAYADEVGAAGIATGHYARIIHDNEGIASLWRGLDPAKDQTYFLYKLTQSQLRRMVMPLGAYTKAEVRELARGFQLPNSEAPESQDACFTQPGETFAQTLEKLFESKGKPGWFIGPNGERIQKHEGLHCYTIGQRKGLRVALGVPAYISRIDSETGEVFLQTEERLLFAETLIAASPNWHSGHPPEFPLRCQVQVRYRSPAVPGTVLLLNNGLLKVCFDTPQRALTPGQGAVFYDNERLLGGAVILE